MNRTDTETIPTFDEQREAFINEARKRVLAALDTYAEEVTGTSRFGPRDADLPELFAGIDPIASRMFDKARGL